MSKREEKRIAFMEKITALIEKNGGLAKTSQLYELGLDYRNIQRFVEDGYLERVKNGYYGIGFREKDEESMIVSLFPDGVLCLDSALYYYHYIQEKPYCWHIAVDKNTSKSRFQMDFPLVQPYYTEPEVLKLGVRKLQLKSGVIGIYDKERLICDCLKYEDKLEREVLQNALKCYLREPVKDIQKLMEYARERRVVQKVQSRIGVWL